MAAILSLETSSRNCSVAVHRDSSVLALAEIHIGQSHASKLAPMIEEVMSLAGLTFDQLDAVAVSSGPGSYTGLRIGVSTAKGLCYALGIPLIAINTLELLAFQVSKMITTNSLLCPMIDARRMEVYCMLVDKNLKVISPVEAKVIDETSFDETLKTNDIIFFGDGAMKCKSVITRKNAFFIDDINPSASQLGFLAYDKFIKNETEDLVNFEPFYLKEFAIKKAVSKTT